ncbi:hypothetical protein [Frigoriflavimonas asaccharolytica]|uniref:ABC-type transporter MlaC component n=1 Tax=Frigoriflavimonas asaccharolytica TaxID=2735899 RepID=A0A8J8KA39_9FLAO|nr:hypothetical protein [Frigoriflavimonas asaccharolytica]NRS91069.1 ABC-type transporter MlaC component [Frigoriflavimonas asaccharolytica]
MTTFNVSIPENKIPFFKEFLNLLGADYEEKNEIFELSNQQKQILDERLKADKKDFIPAREALNKLRQKYEL